MPGVCRRGASFALIGTLASPESTKKCREKREPKASAFPHFQSERSIYSDYVIQNDFTTNDNHNHDDDEDGNDDDNFVQASMSLTGDTTCRNK